MIVELPGHGLSKSGAARGKHWIKQLDGVDPAKDDGFAFIGDFRQFGATVEVADGTWFLAYVEDVSGGGYLRGREVTLYRAAGASMAEVRRWQLDARAGWALKVRDEIASLVGEVPRDLPAPTAAPNRTFTSEVPVTWAKVTSLPADLEALKAGLEAVKANLASLNDWAAEATAALAERGISDPEFAAFTRELLRWHSWTLGYQFRGERPPADLPPMPGSEEATHG